MKKITLTLSIIAFSAVFSTTAVGQQSANATAASSTSVITPISIAKDLDLTFGTFSTNGTMGTIALTAAATAVTTPSAGITITNRITPTAAKFTVSGDSNFAYSITLPTTITLTGTTTANTMTVSNFTSVPSTNGVLTVGKEIVYVGGILNVPASTIADVYTNAADLKVIVNYN
jgi:hypothetical protein